MTLITHETTTRELEKMTKKELIGALVHLEGHPKYERSTHFRRFSKTDLVTRAEQHVEKLRAKHAEQEKEQEKERRAQLSCEREDGAIDEILGVVIERLRKLIDENQKTIDKYKQATQEDPVYALRWHTDDMLEAVETQKRRTLLRDFLHDCLSEEDRKTIDEILAFLKHDVNDNLRRCLDGYNARCTNPIENHARMIEHTALCKFTKWEGNMIEAIESDLREGFANGCKYLSDFVSGKWIEVYDLDQSTDAF